MAYVLIRGARNTLAVRRPRAVRRGMWGLGQAACANYDSDSGLCLDSTTDVPTSTTLPTAAGPVTSTGALPTSYLPSGEAIATQYTIGSQGTCPAGQIVVDQYGSCGPSSTLASTLASPSGASSLGLSPTAAAQIANALNAAGTAVKIATGQAVTPVAVVSTNPFASVSPTVWLVGAAVLVGIVLVSKKR
jgi:hypothetical protein